MSALLADTAVLKSGRCVGTLDAIDIRSIEFGSTTAGCASLDEAIVLDGRTIVGALIGGIAGAGSGAGVGAGSQVLLKGQRVRILSETRLSFLLEQPVRI
ncbi:MAG: hypothetical protein SGI92_27355 [Bryobacteraceae bacterium]|nr:hypothetical protein [Bryobacteraceae bacterium]